jgi:hypothetical protein
MQELMDDLVVLTHVQNLFIAAMLVMFALLVAYFVFD